MHTALRISISAERLARRSAAQAGTARWNGVFGGEITGRRGDGTCFSVLPHVEIRFLRKGVYLMSEVSTFRLYGLRAMYVFMFVGLALTRWPGILNPPPGI